MPFYEYECAKCGHQFEAMQKISDAPLGKCPECGRRALKKLMSSPVFRLKGSGWYETDFKSDKEGKRNLADAPDKDEKKDEKSEEKKDDKKEDKKDDKKGEQQGEAKKAEARSEAPTESKGESPAKSTAASATSAKTPKQKSRAPRPKARKAK
ncbi:MAG TPA: zinc ribbon domain-containing protein [Steroidobacteraceae bacterium]|nr:zinc ribbon domain-containing protein [Steroidobacteraceae bacterium]